MDEIIEQHEQPIMVLNRRLSRHPAHCVYAGSAGGGGDGGGQAGGHGAQEIAFIAGSADSTGAERLASYRQALIGTASPCRRP
jgi:LacI family asc operon transcriptional repressor